MATTLKEKTAESNPYHPTTQLLTLLFSVSHSFASFLSSSYHFGFSPKCSLDSSLACYATSCTPDLGAMQDAELIDCQRPHILQHDVTLFCK